MCRPTTCVGTSVTESAAGLTWLRGTQRPLCSDVDCRNSCRTLWRISTEIWTVFALRLRCLAWPRSIVPCRRSRSFLHNKFTTHQRGTVSIAVLLRSSLWTDVGVGRTTSVHSDDDNNNIDKCTKRQHRTSCFSISVASCFLVKSMKRSQESR